MTDNRPMQRASDFDPEVLLIFDQYVHGDIDRRTFLARVGKFAVGTVTAAGLLGALSPRFAEAQQIAPTDARLEGRYVEYDSPKGHGRARGYLVRPAGAKGPLPLVLVVHENRGLNPHIEDVARRVALENFVALAPDALFPLGGYPGDEDQARTLFQKLEQPKAFEDFVAATHFLRVQPGSSDRLGVVGFCYGGAIANRLAVALPDLAAAVPFYGSAPPLDQRGRDQGGAAAAFRRERRAGECQLAAVRGGAEGGRREAHGALLPGHAARVSQRYDAALRRGGRQARLGADRGAFQQGAARVTDVIRLAGRVGGGRRGRRCSLASSSRPMGRLGLVLQRIDSSGSRGEPDVT